MRQIWRIIDIEPEDRQLIRDFIIAITISGSFVLGIFLVMTLVFFYGDPFTIFLVALALMLKIRVSEEGIEISFEKFINRYLKISVTIIK